MDPYKILGIERGATLAEIKKAYRAMAKKHHPDRGGDAWAFQLVQDAYQSLTGKLKILSPESKGKQAAPAEPELPPDLWFSDLDQLFQDADSPEQVEPAGQPQRRPRRSLFAKMPLPFRRLSKGQQPGQSLFHQRAPARRNVGWKRISKIPLWGLIAVSLFGTLLSLSYTVYRLNLAQRTVRQFTPNHRQEQPRSELPASPLTQQPPSQQPPAERPPPVAAVPNPPAPAAAPVRSLANQPSRPAPQPSPRPAPNHPPAVASSGHSRSSTVVQPKVSVQVEVAQSSRGAAAPRPNRPQPGAPNPVNRQPAKSGVNLLEGLDLEAAKKWGRWEQTKEGLRSDGQQATRLEIADAPPGEYDFSIVFTPLVDKACAVPCCWAFGKGISCDFGGWEGSIVAFQKVDGQIGIANKTASKARTPQGWLTKGKRHTVKIEVRRNRLAAYLDGQLVTKFNTDYRNVSYREDWAISPGKLGIGTWQSPTIFHEARFEPVGQR